MKMADKLKMTKNQRRLYDALRTGKGLRGKFDRKCFNMSIASHCIAGVCEVLFPVDPCLATYDIINVCTGVPLDTAKNLSYGDAPIWKDTTRVFDSTGVRGAISAAAAFKRACAV